jgi:hypothetical protein
MIQKIKAAWEVLQKGKSLTNKELWKKVQLASSEVAGLIVSILVFFPSLNLTPEDIKLISEAISYVGGFIVGDVTVTAEGVRSILAGISAGIMLVLVPYLGVATTDRIGLPTSSKVDTVEHTDQSTGSKNPLQR